VLIRSVLIARFGLSPDGDVSLIVAPVLLNSMMSILLYIFLLALPVIAFKFNRRLRTPLSAGMICLGTIIAGALLLWWILDLFYAEFHPAFTEIYKRELAEYPDVSEFSPEGRADRQISVMSIPILGLAMLWYTIVCSTELFKAARTPNESSRPQTQMQCMQCGHSIVADLEMAGLDGNCPECKTAFTFPPAEST